MARIERRPACHLYHSALQIEVPEARFVIEQAPVADLSGEQRGVVAAGAVGSRWASRFRIFRYEIRLWRNGHIPDVIEAVESPRRLASDQHRARRVLDVVGQVPTPVWGRNELGTGAMWNSNSVIACVRSGIHAESIRPPAGGRAPGWQAGIEVAHRQEPHIRIRATTVYRRVRARLTDATLRSRFRTEGSVALVLRASGSPPACATNGEPRMPHGLSRQRGSVVAGYVVRAAARRSPRCLIPSSILRSIVRDPGSIGSIASGRRGLAVAQFSSQRARLASEAGSGCG